ncbi:lysozyme [Undibacterium sp. TJN25]|uniref:lysozyme n=1 Tax=Undibacterium sp. TJN25 TaxID=3413056 RepID=UPI003BF1666F
MDEPGFHYGIADMFLIKRISRCRLRLLLRRSQLRGQFCDQCSYNEYSVANGGVKLGQTATLDQCNELLLQDLLKADTAINSCVHVPLNDNQRAAFASFAFNAGGGKVLPGLVKRRVAEREVCFGGAHESLYQAANGSCSHRCPVRGCAGSGTSRRRTRQKWDQEKLETAEAEKVALLTRVKNNERIAE